VTWSLLEQKLVAALLQPQWGQVAMESPRLVPFVMDLKVVVMPPAAV
jgi:hypothetical protein